ncbi:atherin-like [Phyllostomus discolor]|uniref:Atherin-like n=1 Tax=Phyllostomus discolor TaxID=89673 RepID=A0A7E6CHA9_9CHIR|nr:atherin-like [Phyllostomus discolor]
MGQARCRAAPRPAARSPGAKGPAKASVPRGPARGARPPSPPPAPAGGTPGAEGAGRAQVPAWRVVASNRAPPRPTPERGGETVIRERRGTPGNSPARTTAASAPPPLPLRSPPPAAAGLGQPQAPRSSPIYKLGARSWELEMRFSLPSASFPLVPTPLRTPPRLGWPAPLSPPPSVENVVDAETDSSDLLSEKDWLPGCRTAGSAWDQLSCRKPTGSNTGPDPSQRGPY